ncbi:MAG: trigger factor [Acidobacteria bacterium]|nr:trigger factor [Acidobacteriota bacterium]
MKHEYSETSETQKVLTFEVPADVVEAEIARVAAGYSKSARVPGFRQGKVPATVVRQRYKDQILYDVAHDMIPRFVSQVLKERELAPIATPDIRDVVIEEGQALTFAAHFETLPPIDPGTYTGISLRKPAAVLEVGAVDQTLEQLRQRAAKWLPVEDRASMTGDAVLMDLTRTVRGSLIVTPGEPSGDSAPEPMENVSVEIGATANPPGFDEHLTGLKGGDTKSFTVNYPADYQMPELAGKTVAYDASVKAVRRKELADLDDSFAKEVSEFETIDALREQIKKDLQHQAEHDADHSVRHDLLKVLAGRLTNEVPATLVERETERRLEDLVRRLMEQGVDPMKANVNWQEFRERQKAGAEESVRSTLVLDDIARRENIEATEEDVDQEIAKFAERAGRAPAAVRARLEKEEGLDRIRAGIQREKTMTWLLDKAAIVNG